MGRIPEDQLDDLAKLKAQPKRCAAMLSRLKQCATWLKPGGMFRRRAKRIAFLARNPGAGHWRNNLTDEAVRFFPVYSYLIVCRPDTKPLLVYAILHGHRDTKRIEILHIRHGPRQEFESREVM